MIEEKKGLSNQKERLGQEKERLVEKVLEILTSDKIKTSETTDSQEERVRKYFLDEFGDYKWQSYMRYSPLRNPELETFVTTVRNAEVETCRWKMTIDGELQNNDSGEIWTAENSRKSPDKILIDFISLELEFDKDNEWSIAETIYVVRLPMEIPFVEESILRDTLFVREDDLAQFKMVRSLRKVVMTGNPGIGKSWFQWQVFLWSLRPDIFGKLSGECEGCNELPPNHNNDSLHPSVILRYVAGQQVCHVFFLDENTPIVHELKKFDDFHFLDRDDSLLLFEPGRSVDPIPYEFIVKMQILATVSPDKTRTKEFIKHEGIQSIMPCPSTSELLAMANYTRPFSSNQESFTNEETLKRIERFGPFNRYVLAISERAGKEFAAQLQAAENALSGEKLKSLVKFYSIEKSSANEQVSHWFLRYEVDRRSKDPYDVESAFLMFSTKATFAMLCKKRDEVDEAVKISALQQFDACLGKGVADISRIWLEDVFITLVGEGLTWRLINTQWSKDNALTLVQAGTIDINVAKKNLGPAPAEIKEKVLYARMGSNFPFVDGVWMERNCVFSFRQQPAYHIPRKSEHS